MRIADKIEEIEKYLTELSQIKPTSLEQYLEIKNKASCERYFEKIIKAVIDLSKLILKEKNLIIDDERKLFDKLCEAQIINPQLADRLKDAKGMRNIIAHEYGRIDDSIVYNSITTEIERDVAEFIKIVKKMY